MNSKFEFQILLKRNGLARERRSVEQPARTRARVARTDGRETKKIRKQRSYKVFVICRGCLGSLGGGLVAQLLFT